MREARRRSAFPGRFTRADKSLGTSDVLSLATASNVLHYNERPYWQLWTERARGALSGYDNATCCFPETVMMPEAAEAYGRNCNGPALAVRESLALSSSSCTALDIAVDDGCAYYFCATEARGRKKRSNTSRLAVRNDRCRDCVSARAEQSGVQVREALEGTPYTDDAQARTDAASRAIWRSPPSPSIGRDSYHASRILDFDRARSSVWHPRVVLAESSRRKSRNRGPKWPNTLKRRSRRQLEVVRQGTSLNAKR